MTATFNAGLLQIARQARGMSQVELSKLSGVTQGYLSKLENGLTEPTDEVIQKLGGALGFPMTFFSQNDPVYGLPVSVHPMYRRKASVGQKELDRLQAELNIRLLHFRRLLKAAEFDGELPRPSVDVADYDGSPEKVAEMVRQVWSVPRGPISNLISYIERSGCFVVLVDLPGVAVDGVTVSAPGVPPCIFVNRHQPADRLRFTLAHELGHIVMHRVPSPEMEDEANEFASALLMPTKDIRPALTGRLSLERLAALKPVWRVSMQALLVRAARTGAITSSQSQYLWRQISRLGLRNREPPELDFPAEAPKVVPQLILLHLSELGYTISDLSAALHVAEADLRSMYFLEEQVEKKKPNLRLVT
jgi:Zn-dependent peptidase ImmA (M78 family)/transcriptional regulator with XRE-family HTH domain